MSNLILSMVKTRVFLLLTFFFVLIPVCGQTMKVTGTVIDKENDEPLIGATILHVDSKLGTATNLDGWFELDIPSGKSNLLEVKYIGYKTVNIKATPGKPMTIYLEPNTVLLDEVVSIGYASMNRRDLTGSVSSVNANQIKDIPLVSAAQALTGRLAGVQITTSEGSPNAEFNIRIRGGGSITQDNSPLYIVDGVQMENALAVISPQEIASVDVLKDASTTALYGARGANGVVLITTKSGAEQKTTVSYNGTVGLGYLSKKLDVLDPYEFVLYQYERSRGSLKDEENFIYRYAETYEDISNYKNREMVNWQDKMMGNTAITQTHNINITGGNKKTKFNINYLYNKNEGILAYTGLTKHQFTSKITHSLFDWLDFGANVRYNNQTTDGAGMSDPGTASLNNLRNLIKYRPFVVPGSAEDEFDPEYTEESYGGMGLGLVNPAALFKGQYRKYNQENINLSGHVNIKFTNYLSFKSTLGLNLSHSKQDSFDDFMTPNAMYNYGGNPFVRQSRTDGKTMNQSNVLTYTNAKSKSAFSKANSINVLLGHEIFINQKEGLEHRLKDFPIGITPESAFGQITKGKILAGYPSSSYSRNTLLSFFTRMNYTFKQRYLFSFTYRGDGSSKFAKGNKWGFFPSGSIAWRVSKEAFMQNVDEISDLKIRFSYGKSGNNRINDYMYQTFYKDDIYGLNNNTSTGALIPNSLGNSNLKWETTVSKNVGLDLGLLNNRIQLSLDYYDNKTEDLLLNTPISYSSGYKNQIQNTGSTRNRGIEAQIQAMIIEGKNFSWSANFNIAYNKNKILKLADRQESYVQNSGWGASQADYIIKVGEAVGTIYGYESDGFYTVDDFDYAPDPANPGFGRYTLKEGLADPSKVIGTPQPGMMKFKSGDDGVLDDKDKKILGCGTPKLTGGLNQQFIYKNIDLSLFVNFQWGNKVLNASKVEFSNGYSPNSNLLGHMKNRWRTVDKLGNVVQKTIQENGKNVILGIAPDELSTLNKDASIWMATRDAAGFIPTSWAVEDASFLRINNITLGYTFKSALLKRFQISQFRLYMTANNLAVFTKYSGYDPEVDTRRSSRVTPGVDYSAYPRTRSFLFGTNITF